MNPRNAIAARWNVVKRHPFWFRGRNVECPCCGERFSHFAPYNGRAGARCPSCSSAERHRALWLFLERETNLLSVNQSVLHFAPEHAIGGRLSKLSNLEYVSGDLTPGAAQEAMDITAIPKPSQSFDVVLCSHVLEHVPDDMRATREIFRVLKPGGTAYLQHPIDLDRATTYEDPSVVDPGDRAREFGQDDHVRVYGRDFVDRVRDAGFEVTRCCYDQAVSSAERTRFGLATDPRLQWAGDIYIAHRPREVQRP